MGLLFILTASYAQDGKFIITSIGDTLIGYSKDELKLIATKIVQFDECDSISKITDQQLQLQKETISAKDSVISNKDSVITNKNRVIFLKDEIISGKEDEISELRKTIKKQATKEKLLKIGWSSSSAGLIFGLILLLTR